MPLTYQAIASITVGAAGANNLTFSSIPQTFTDLVVKISGRTLAGGVADALGMYINGVQSNRVRISLTGNGAGASSDTSTYRDIGASNAQGTTTNTFSNAEVYLPNYRSSTAYKSFSVDSVYENNATTAGVTFIAGLWSSTAPITSLMFDSASAGVNFVQYSTFTLYGIKNS